MIFFRLRTDTPLGRSFFSQADGAAPCQEYFCWPCTYGCCRAVCVQEVCGPFVLPPLFLHSVGTCVKTFVFYPGSSLTVGFCNAEMTGRSTLGFERRGVLYVFEVYAITSGPPHWPTSGEVVASTRDLLVFCSVGKFMLCWGVL